MLSYLVHFISGKAICFEFFVLYCHFICGIRSIIILHTENASFDQVEEVVFIFRFSSTTSIFFLQFLKLVMCCNFIHVLAGFFVCAAAWIIAVLTKHRREEWPAYTLVVVVEALENQKSRYRHKDDSVSIFHLISKHLVLFWSCFNNGCEVNKLLAFLGWDEVCFTFLPALLEFN